jgi:hypothetical protein
MPGFSAINAPLTLPSVYESESEESMFRHIQLNTGSIAITPAQHPPESEMDPDKKTCDIPSPSIENENDEDDEISEDDEDGGMRDTTSDVGIHTYTNEIDADDTTASDSSSDQDVSDSDSEYDSADPEKVDTNTYIEMKEYNHIFTGIPRTTILDVDAAQWRFQAWAGIVPFGMSVKAMMKG